MSHKNYRKKYRHVQTTTLALFFIAGNTELLEYRCVFCVCPSVFCVMGSSFPFRYFAI